VDLETRGEIERIPGKSPQRLRLPSSARRHRSAVIEFHDRHEAVSCFG
jgi:hypothetical protein